MSQQELDHWFATAPEAQRATLSALRKRVKSLRPDVVEAFKWSRPCYASGRGLFCYLQSARHHVTLGFYQGASLDDPENLLEGTGKDLRHIKIKDGANPDAPAIEAILRQAASR